MGEHTRQIDKWLKWMAVLGPLVSGMTFGAAGYVSGYNQCRTQILANGHRLDLMEGWKDRQEAFNQQTVAAIARLKALMKDIP